MKENELFDKITEILLTSDRTSEEIDQLSVTEEFTRSPFNLLNKMKQTEQSPQHHPEGNVWIHTMMVVAEAAKVRDKSKDKKVFMWAALLHDIGKPEATRIQKGKITAYDHDKMGAEIARKLLEQVCEEEEFIKDVCFMIRWHMQILFIAKNMSFADLKTLKQEVDIDEIALLGTCDRLGRLGVNREAVLQDIKKFKSIAKKG